MRIAYKLFIGFLAVLLLLVSISGLSWQRMKAIESQSTEIERNWMPSVSLLGKIKTEMTDVSRLVLELVIETQPDKVESLKNQLDLAQTALKKNESAFEKLLTTEEQRKLYQTFTKNWEQFAAKIPPILEYASSGDALFANLEYTAIHPVWEQANQALDKLVTVNEAGAYAATARSVSTVESAVLWITGMSAAAISVAILIALLLSRQITRPLRMLRRELMQLAENGGDLTKEITIASKDEVGELSHALNRFLSQLRLVVVNILRDANQVLTLSVQVSEAVRQTSESATQVADTINQMAAGSSRQAEHAASICRKMEDTGHQVEFGFEQAEKTARQTHSSTQAAYEGKAAMRAAVAHLGMINQTVTQSTESIQRLATRSEEIGGIVTTITDISSQTNLLALNAAIEAARAGVQGRGFAVVAEEVRKLADETKRAAEQIAQLISTMQTDTYATVKLMENNLAAMQQQAAMIGKGDESLDLIVSHVEQTDLDAGQMKAIFTGLHQDSRDVLGQIEEISSIIEQSAASSQQIAAATIEQSNAISTIYSNSLEFMKLSKQLQGEVSKFRV